MQKQSLLENKQKTFRKSALVATAIQTRKLKPKEIKQLSENSETDDSIQIRTRIKKKVKVPKNLKRHH